MKTDSLKFTDDSFIDGNIRRFLDDFLSDSEFVVCHTSGSTGVPKDISVRKSAMLYSAKNTVDFFRLNENLTGLLCLPSKFIAGRMMLVRAWLSNMTLHSVEPNLNPLKNITRKSVDFAAFTPAQILEILKDEASKAVFSGIKNVIIGGAAIDVELEKKLLHFSNNIYATYGMTETVSHIALRKIGEKEYKKISSETLLGVDEEKCLWIEDINLYPEKLQTNDVVELLDEDYFIWLGRRDFVINSGGVKLHPEQIEDKIRTLPEWQDREFFIDKISDMRFGERPLLVVSEHQHITDFADLSVILNKMEMPSEMKEVSHFIYTENGKLNRMATARLWM